MTMCYTKLMAICACIPSIAMAQYQFHRDTSSVVGGYGRVDSTVRVTTATGRNETAFEWGVYSILNNYSASGENVAIYGQSNAYSVGPTWGMVSEVADDTGRSGAMVGHEITMNMTGPDSGLRLGLDVVLGDGKYWRGKGESSVVEGTVGIRVGAQSTSHAVKSWRTGYEASGFRVAGLHTVGNSRWNPDGWIASGDYSALINSYGAKMNALIKIPGASQSFQLRPLGGYVGRLRVIIDGNPYYLPIYGE